MKKYLFILLGLAAFTLTTRAQASGHVLSANVSSYLYIELPSYARNGETYAVTITNSTGTIDILVELDSGYSSKWINDTSTNTGHGVYVQNLYYYATLDLTNLPPDTYTVRVTGPGIDDYPQNPFYTPYLALYAD